MTLRVAALVTVGLAVFAGLSLLFGETGVRCTATEIGQTGPGRPIETFAPGRCETTRMIDVQRVWPMPLLAIIVWSSAPLLALAGAWPTRPRTGLVTAALAIEGTSLLSFGAAPVYLPIVLVPLTITWVLARRAARRAGHRSSRGR